jgi:predicted Zn-dependent protease
VGHTDRVIQGAWIQQCTITLMSQPRIDEHLNLLQRQQRLATTILHELGHALGLEHSENKQDVMYFRGWRHSVLSENDIHRIRELYRLKS